MPTAKSKSAVVRAPGRGDLEFGGKELTGSSSNVELMETIAMGVCRVHTCGQIDSMINARRCPSAVYFNCAAYVVG